MKKLITCLLSLFVVTSCTWAAADHKDHKKISGPNGGKIIETASGHVEFYVQEDRKVRITFLDDAMKPLTVGTQSVKAVAEAKGGKVTLEFDKSGEFLVSKTTLPEGDGYRIVLQLRNESTGKPENLRIDYVAATCGGCKLAEYACICEGHGH